VIGAPEGARAVFGSRHLLRTALFGAPSPFGVKGRKQQTPGRNPPAANLVMPAEAGIQ